MQIISKLRNDFSWNQKWIEYFIHLVLELTNVQIGGIFSDECNLTEYFRIGRKIFREMNVKSNTLSWFYDSSPFSWIDGIFGDLKFLKNNIFREIAIEVKHIMNWFDLTEFLVRSIYSDVEELEIPSHRKIFRQINSLVTSL